MVRCHEIGLEKRQVFELANGEQTKGADCFGSSGFDSQIVLLSRMKVDFIGDWVRKAKIEHPGTRCHSANDKHAEDIRRRYADGVFHDDRAMLSTSALQLLGRASAVSRL